MRQFKFIHYKLLHQIIDIMKTKTLLLAIITFAFASCEREDSADVNQDRIYTIYNLVYEADQDVTYARTWFRFGSATGTLLELTKPSYISFNDQNLSFMNALAFYEKKMTGIIDEGSFYWEDYEGVGFENSVSIKEIAFPRAVTEINGDSSFELVWEGQELGFDEYVAVAINGDFEGDATIHFEKGMGSTSITIPKTSLEQLPKNKLATFWLELGYSPFLQQETSAGGEIHGKYRVSKEIMIK